MCRARTPDLVVLPWLAQPSAALCPPCSLRTTSWIVNPAPNSPYVVNQLIASLNNNYRNPLFPLNQFNGSSLTPSQG